VTLLARALDLDRAALLLEAAPRGELEPVAVHDVEGLAAVAPAGAGCGRGAPSSPSARRAGRSASSCSTGAPAPAPPGRRRARHADRRGRGALVEQGRAADLRRTRALLARADRLSALGTLAAGVAHEIRNPLVSVRTFIQLLPERLADEEFRTGFRDLALGEIERICGLINDLLAFARPAPTEREPTDLNEVVGQIVRLLEAEARRRDVAVACRIDEQLPLVVADDAQVKQVLMNVVLNAIQACQAGGSVEISTRIAERNGAQWGVVAVADSGPGIAPEHVEQIFDPFFTTKAGGSGLGLFIAREIVAAHEGVIEAAPRPGGGSEFSIQLPAGTGEERASAL
jgi:signal transduction histidine kinase